MKDSLNEVQKKIINTSQGQASDSHWCYTNHLDYEKWNNHQCYESTAPVFTVMGKFYGLPRLFERTHLFFSKSVLCNSQTELTYSCGTEARLSTPPTFSHLGTDRKVDWRIFVRMTGH
jgi:hypothetical protein